MIPRRTFVIAHDLVMTAAAVVASFYIRFEAAGLMEREKLLLLFLPGFVAYAGVVYYLFHLYEAKWRFASLPDLMNILRASTVLAVSLLVLDYVLVAPNVLGQFFFGKITIVLYWVLQFVFLGGPRLAYRYFRYTRTRHHARAEAANPTLNSRPRRRCRGFAARHRKRRGQEDLAGRRAVAIRRRSGAIDPRHSRARLLFRARCRRQRLCATRHCNLAGGLHAVGVRT